MTILGNLAAALAGLPVVGPLFKAPIPQQPEGKGEKADPTVMSTDRVQPLRDGLARIRKDLASFGTAVGIAAGSATAATTLTTFKDLFPLPAGSQWVAVIVVILMACSAVGSILLTRQFFNARRRIVVETSVLSPLQEQDRRNDGIDVGEREFLTKPLEEYATGEGAPDARTLQFRRDRLQRVSAALDQAGLKKEAAVANKEAERLTEGITLAAVSGAVELLEHRSVQVYRSGLTVMFALLVALGTGGQFLIADWSRGERDQVKQFLACRKDAKNDIEDAVCADLDPRKAPRPSNSASGSPSTSTVKSSSTPQPSDVLSRLNECATVSISSQVPSPLRDAGIAACAGLVPSAGASPPGSR